MAIKDRLLRLLPLPVLAVVDYGIQVGPHDAQTNICGWAQYIYPVSDTCLHNHTGAVWAVLGAGLVGTLAWFLWPEPATETIASALSLPTMHVTDIAEYLWKKSKWGWEQRLRLTMWGYVHDHVAAEMRRAGRDYAVRYIGTPPNSDVAVEIDRTYWRFSSIDDSRIWDRRNNFFTEPLPNAAVAWQPGYQYGSAPRVDVMHAWPAASFLFRAWVAARLWLRRARYGFPKFLAERETMQTLVNSDGEFEDFKVQSPEDKAIENLLRLRTDGITHRNKRVLDNDELTAWIAAFESWRGSVLENARIISPSLENWLHHLDQMQSPPGNIMLFNQEHLRLVSVMSEVLSRMQKFQEEGILSVGR